MMATLRRTLMEAVDANTGIARAFTSRSVPLRAWLFLLSMVAMLPIMAFAGYTIFEQAHHAQNALLSGLQTRTNDAGRTIDQALQKHVAVIRALANDPRMEASDFEKLHEQAKRIVQSQPELRNITLADNNDNVIFWTYSPYGTPGLRLHEQPSLQKARQSKAPTLSRAFFAPVGGPPVFLVTVPVLRQSDSIFVLRAAIQVAAIEKLLADLQLPEGWVAGVAESGGRLIARSRLSQQFMDKPASPEFVAAIQRQESFSFKATTVDGVSVTSAIAPVFAGNWHLAIAVSDEVLLAPLKATMTKLLILGILWLMLGLVLARWLSNYLAQQAKQLVNEIHAHPDTANPGKLSVTEFRQLMIDSQTSRREMFDIQKELASVQAERDEVFDLYELAPCGYHSLDAAGQVVRMNQTELAMLGYPLGEVLGRRITDFMTAQSKATFEANFPHFLATGNASDLHFEFVRKDGTLLPVRLDATAVFDDAGKYVLSRTTLLPVYPPASDQGPAS